MATTAGNFQQSSRPLNFVAAKNSSSFSLCLENSLLFLCILPTSVKESGIGRYPSVFNSSK